MITKDNTTQKEITFNHIKDNIRTIRELNNLVSDYNRLFKNNSLVSKKSYQNNYIIEHSKEENHL